MPAVSVWTFPRRWLAGPHGKAFDEEYMRAMVKNHNKAVMLFQGEERSDQNPEQTISPKNAAHSPDAPEDGPGVVA